MEQGGLFKVDSACFTVLSFTPMVEGENAFCDQVLTVDKLWMHSFDMKLKLRSLISLQKKMSESGYSVSNTHHVLPLLSVYAVPPSATSPLITYITGTVA